MFWKYNYAVSPQIEQLLEKEDVTLAELMDEEDILQECKAQNKKLVEFLLRPTILEQLVTLITTEPSADLEEQSRYRHSNTACEILTCDLPALNERLSGDSTLLQTLYAFIEQEPPLNPLLCSFFSKTLAMLITRRSEQNWYAYQFSCLQVVEFLKSRPECVSALIKHMATPAIMDLLFKLISQVEGNEMRSSVISWLDSQKIVPNLVCLLKPEYGPDIHCNVSQLLCDVVRADREARVEHPDVDCVLTTLESPATVTLVLEHILCEPRMESSIVGGIQFLLALLDQSTRAVPAYVNDNGAKDELLHNAQQQEVVAALLPYLNDFHDVLVNPPKKHSIKTTVGLLEVPVGNARLQIARFICTLIDYSDSPGCCEALADLGIIETLLDLFFEYSWNNFLHGYVEKCIAGILQCTGSEVTCLQKRLFDEGRLIQRMLEGWNNNIYQQALEKGIRRGYMGHIIKILNHIESISSEPLKEFISSTLSKDSEMEEAWSTFLLGPLQDVNKTQSALLGGVHPNQCKSDETNEDFKEIPFPATSIHHSQIGDVPPVFTDTFGNFDEDNLDTDMESNLGAFINSLGMNTQSYRENDDWQMSGDTGEMGSKNSDDPWNNDITNIGSINPWSTASDNIQDQGWADFSSDNFADFDANFCKLSNASTCIPEDNIKNEDFPDTLQKDALSTTIESEPGDTVNPAIEKISEIHIGDKCESSGNEIKIDDRSELPGNEIKNDDKSEPSSNEEKIDDKNESSSGNEIKNDDKSERSSNEEKVDDSSESLANEEKVDDKSESLANEEKVDDKSEPPEDNSSNDSIKISGENHIMNSVEHIEEDSDCNETKKEEVSRELVEDMSQNCSMEIEKNSLEKESTLVSLPTTIAQNSEDLQIKCENVN